MLKEKLIGWLQDDIVLLQNTDQALNLVNQQCYGIVVDKKIQLSLIEALYLVEKKKIEVMKTTHKSYDFYELLKKMQKKEKNFWTRYVVYRDLRTRGYIVKSALKFGADFRVYERGVKPGQAHAKWIVYPVKETQIFTWYEFSAKNRVAHSTKKNLLIAIVDEENDVTYYEISWKRP